MAASGPLTGFVLERVLREDVQTRSASLLGYFHQQEGTTICKDVAVVNIEKTPFTPSFYANVGVTAPHSSIVQQRSLGSNDVYHWLLAWSGSGHDADPHIKMTLIRPATEKHILKYSAQSKIMVQETPQLYLSVVKPYIESQPPQRIQWVYNILDKLKEADTILYEDQCKQQGFIIVPDLKWDQSTLSSLYLVAIVHNRTLRSLRDLKKEHIPMLQNIYEQAQHVASTKFGLREGKLRCFLHYHPSYYHLHVHILSSDYVQHSGAIVGQAHLLDDVIDLLHLGIDMTQRTLTYALGDQSDLLPLLRAKPSVSE